MTFCFKCPECGYAVETSVREPAPTHFHSWKPEAHKLPQPKREITMVRDYRAEGAGVDRWALKFWGTRHQRRDPENP